MARQLLLTCLVRHSICTFLYYYYDVDKKGRKQERKEERNEEMREVFLGIVVMACWMGCSSWVYRSSSNKLFSLMTHRKASFLQMSQLEYSPVFGLSLHQLSTSMDGSGKAKAIWRALRAGTDPLESGTLSIKAKVSLRKILSGKPLIETFIVSKSVAECGTRKLLIGLGDGLQVETVLIPSAKFNRTTLCISTQVGCDRGCAFCLTGRMGLIRNLTTSEILCQVFHGIQTSINHSMPPLLNSTSFSCFSIKIEVILFIHFLCSRFHGYGRCWKKCEECSRGS